MGSTGLRPHQRSVLGGVLLLLVGALLVALLVDRSGKVSDGNAHADVSGPFIAAYRRSLEATYAVEGEFTRTMADGRTLRSGVLIAQRPPDWIRRQLGGASGAIGGRTLNCSTTPSGEFVCGQGTEASPYADDVEYRVEIIASYFDPVSPPVYRVESTSQGCYHLELVRQVPDPSYGERSVMCFDELTGAMSRFELQRADGSTDLVEAVTIRQPTDLDFTVNRNSAFDQRNDDLQGAQSGSTVFSPETSPVPVTTE